MRTCPRNLSGKAGGFYLDAQGSELHRRKIEDEMSRYLVVDVGAGTMDILYFNDESSEHYKAVARSPVLHLAEKARRLSGKLLVTGFEMGGGPITEILREQAQRADVIMSRSAALTLNHDLEKVTSWGIEVIEDAEAECLRNEPGFQCLTIADLDAERIRSIIEGLGVPFEFDIVGVCAQDHGMPPSGVSHLDFRHNIFKAELDKNPFPHSLLYRGDEVPDTFNRLKSLVESAREFPADEIYVMDSGMAAIVGASMDSRASLEERMIVLDVATSHTVGAALEKGEIAGFFEYHTRDITLNLLEGLLAKLAEGTLDHQSILEGGGHGAYVRKSLGLESIGIILATGPRRGLLKESRLPLVMGAPLGDNMMTGTVGVLESIRRHKGLHSLSYL